MINFAATLSRWTQISPEVKRLIDTFISPQGVGRRYLLGRNEHSAALSKVIDIDGFLDDYADPGMIYNGKPIMSGEEIPKNAIIINCSMAIRPISAHKRIKKLGVAGCLAYADFCKALPDLVPLPEFVTETRNDIHNNPAKWRILRQSLFDDHSRQVLDDIVNYRLTGDYGFMKSYTFRPEDQYFEDFLYLGPRQIFVDAGGFDGDTTELFCERYPDYEKVWFFEPSPTNHKKAQSRLSRFRSIEFIELGLSDSVGKIAFNPNDGPSSSISENGSFQIDITTLDQKVKGKVTFIKMDLEGWEKKALEGSKRHIIEDYPRLAISVYHNSSDFWRIFDFVFNLRQDYDIFLRHYTEGWSETVMYFVPHL